MVEQALASHSRAFETLASVAHEMKQPITSIHGFAEVLEAQIEAADSRELVGLIRSEGEALTALVEDLMTAGLARSDRLRVDAELVSEVGEELARVVAASAPERASFRADGVEDVQVLVDLRRLGQVVRGLLSNAVRYGGPTITVRMEVGAQLIVAVADDGPVVPPDEIERIFELFRHGEAGRGIGTGIGLAVARSIVADMGGVLEYRPRDPGAEFRITLPVVGAAATGAELDPMAEMEALVSELTDFRGDDARLRLNRLAFRHRASRIIEEVVPPAMYEVGERGRRHTLEDFGHHFRALPRGADVFRAHVDFGLGAENPAPKTGWETG